eukprot:TRINITY_DN9291_c0_g1_i5.p1 TRINITY_DN9291_c0_g1~~TRINITY_DN9291_c0_g1_i5.p1  ORF type:complete len:139 (+),score=4.02 TRINITY_DN9291_c0_g1_i5:251-667(+)
MTINDQDSSKEISMALWGQFASIDRDTIERNLQSYPIILATAVKMLTLQGGSISTTPNTAIQLDLDIKEKGELRKWCLLDRIFVSFTLYRRLIVSCIKFKYTSITGQTKMQRNLIAYTKIQLLKHLLGYMNKKQSTSS